MEHIFVIVLFAISTMATPGPNTLMILSSGVNFGGGGPPGSAGSQMMAGIPGFGPPGTPGYRPME